MMLLLMAFGGITLHTFKSKLPLQNLPKLHFPHFFLLPLLQFTKVLCRYTVYSGDALKNYTIVTF